MTVTIPDTLEFEVVDVHAGEVLEAIAADIWICKRCTMDNPK